MKKWALPLLIYDFSIFIHNSASLFRECSDHFLRGEIFHENFKIISKKIKIFLWKNLENKNFHEFSQKFFKIFEIFERFLVEFFYFLFFSFFLCCFFTNSLLLTLLLCNSLYCCINTTLFYFAFLDWSLFAQILFKSLIYSRFWTFYFVIFLPLFAKFFLAFCRFFTFF